MPGTVGQIERKTQQRVVKLFRDLKGFVRERSGEL
jgi:hypothetical protein